MHDVRGRPRGNANLAVMESKSDSRQHYDCFSAAISHTGNLLAHFNHSNGHVWAIYSFRGCPILCEDLHRSLRETLRLGEC